MQIKISKLWLTELRRNLYHVIGVQRQAKLDIGFLSKKEFIPTNSPCFLLFVHSQLHVYPLQFVNIVYFFVCLSTHKKFYFIDDDVHTCHLCCSAAPSLLHCGPSEWHNSHNLHTHSTSLQQKKQTKKQHRLQQVIHSIWEDKYVFNKDMWTAGLPTVCTGLIVNILHMSLSNPEEASVAPLGWNLQQ